MPKRPTTRSSGNVFVDLGFAPAEAEVLTMRADLMARLRITIERKGWTQIEAAAALGISQSRVSNLVRGKWDKFSLDMLLTLAARAGLQPRLKLTRAA
jgi:predicted XRE-type DNA-binding protein